MPANGRHASPLGSTDFALLNPGYLLARWASFKIEHSVNCRLTKIACETYFLLFR